MVRNMGALKGHLWNRAHAETGAREIKKLPGSGCAWKNADYLTQSGVKLGRILWAVIKNTLGSQANVFSMRAAIDILPAGRAGRRLNAKDSLMA